MSSRLNFFFTEAIRSLTTNLATSIAATASMLVALLVVGTLLIIISYAAGEAKVVARDAGKVKVFLDETITEEQLNAIIEQARTTPELEGEPEYLTKEDALKKAKETIFDEDEKILENLPSNPFPASVEFKLQDPKQSEKVGARFKDEPGVESIGTGGEDARAAIDTLTLVSGVLAVIGAFLVVAGTFLISNTIRLSIFARRREIEIMKLVGASNNFVRLPFMLEGLLFGMVAAVGAIVMIVLVGVLLKGAFQDTPILGDGNPVVPVALILLGLFGVGVMLGSLGSGLTIRKYLRV